MKESFISLLDQTGLSLSEQQIQQLLDYVALLDKWNQAYNLTSVRDPEEMLTKHILDSLVVSSHLNPGHYIDVGTGPGLPGVPLAIARPDCQFVLLDSLGKRIRFLKQVKHQLKLENIEPVQSRVEQYSPDVTLQGVLSRAFASLSDMVNWCAHLIKPGQEFLALKGVASQEEIDQLPDIVEMKEIIPLDVPGLNAERHLIKITKRG
ncbi:16S rRNA (guanine(527)-N(7))-methyltransferase RsmG [Algicola sagamiensis]|uniref:16S rRNA (guanine(527)-N(7))-methyltransferase RsmG n=1 Tax=Algicola sagamiensis TaxID=163869 RepID=UPI00037E66F5|nr:16S rRNA (guanine(527)-N(7))-methyltransferase RsmG [Algicola sagamiensis]